MSQPTGLDHTKAQAFAARLVDDVGNAFRGAMYFIGVRLGLFKALADAGPVTVDELAQRTGFHPRYLREWLGSMVTVDYVDYDVATRRYRLPPEHASALADEDSPYFAAGLVELIIPFMSVVPRVMEAFSTGGGVREEEYPLLTWEAMERLTMPWYKHLLVQRWIPGMPEVQAKLEAGGSALDVGCGSGRAVLTMAKAFPRARVCGTDFHPASIERARANAEAAGLSDRVRFDVVNGSTFIPDETFDFVTTFMVVHDAADPLGMVTAIRKSLAPDGTYLWVEQNLSAEVHENKTPVGRVMYSMSTLYCMTTSLSHGGAGLGACMGEAKARELAAAAGFTRFRRLPFDTPPFPVLYELKP